MPVPNTSPVRSPSARFKVVAGMLGVPGVIAAWMTLTFDVSAPPATSSSFTRLSTLSWSARVVSTSPLSRMSSLSVSRST